MGKTHNQKKNTSNKLTTPQRLKEKEEIQEENLNSSNLKFLQLLKKKTSRFLRFHKQTFNPQFPSISQQFLERNRFTIEEKKWFKFALKLQTRRTYHKIQIPAKLHKLALKLCSPC